MIVLLAIKMCFLSSKLIKSLKSRKKHPLGKKKGTGPVKKLLLSKRALKKLFCISKSLLIPWLKVIRGSFRSKKAKRLHMEIEQ